MLLNNVQSDQRRIGKGQSLTLGRLFFPVEAGGDPEIEKAILLYDGRNRISIGQSSGAVTGSAGSDIATPDSTEVVITWLDLRHHGLPPADAVSLLKRHDPLVPLAIDIRSLAPTLVYPDSITRETCALVAVLDGAWRWLELKGAHFASKRGIWTQLGYLDCSKRWFLEELQENQSPIPGSNITLDTREVCEILQSSALSVIYPVGKRMVIDLLHASHLLDSTVFRAEEGTNANVWGSAFEAAVQNVIDKSPWRPPDALRPLIGRVIRNGRNAITDIDAVAVADDTLLLIDAKAFRMSPGLAGGEYSAVRTMKQRVEAASARWRDIIALMRRNPELLGIPIPSELKIDGLVVLPFIPYVSIGAATEQVLSLLRASSFSELLLAPIRLYQPLLAVLPIGADRSGQDHGQGWRVAPSKTRG